jgi:hypothetical protein
MKTVYRYNPETNFVHLCGWHPTKLELEARAAAEHPGAIISHGICPECQAKLLGELREVQQASKEAPLIA